MMYAINHGPGARVVNGKVGVAPGTTTVYMPYVEPYTMRGGGGLGLIDETGPFWWTGRERAYRPIYRENTSPRTPVRQLSRWPIEVAGVVAPGMSLEGHGGHLGAIDPAFIRWRPQTTVPSDEDLSWLYGYLPVEAGWLPPMMQPPSSPPGMAGFGSAAWALAQAQPAIPPSANGQALNDLIALQRRQVKLQAASTIAISVIALTALVGCFWPRS